MVALSVEFALPSGRQVIAIIKGRRGAQRMTLRVDPISHRLVVNGPARVSKRDALNFVAAHHDWVERRFAALPSSAPFLEGAHILFRGRPTLLRRRDGRGAAIYRDSEVPELDIAAGEARFERKVELALKAYAHSDALSFSDRLSPHLGVAPQSLALRDTRSRWGSCNSKGDIMLSWRLIAAPPKVFEYVVAHELAHLRELNHSARFWGHVSALVPDWQMARAWLKANGAQLHALGRGGGL
jgi:predicted metal-dependent hydrolase